MHIKLDFFSQNLSYILYALAQPEAETRLVGGCVRDSLLFMMQSHLEAKKEPTISDIDLATTLRPEEVLEILKHKNIKAIAPGLKFGTVIAILGNESFEITTLRQDISCDGRYAEVAYSYDFREDAARRDFTINAMSYDFFKAELYDYFGGVEDLKAAKVRFIGDPKKRISEDYLRILRFFRFSARFAKNFDEAGLRACREYKKLLSNLSKERIKAELDKILQFPNAAVALKQMQRDGIFSVITPNLNWQFDKLENLLHFARQGNVNQVQLYTKYALLLLHSKDISQLRDSLGVLAFTKADIKRIIYILKQISLISSGNLDDVICDSWFDNLINIEEFLALLVVTEFVDFSVFLEYKNKIASGDIDNFPVNGNDVKNYGFQSAEINIVLNKLKKIWWKNNFQLNKQKLLQFI